MKNTRKTGWGQIKRPVGVLGRFSAKAYNAAIRGEREAESMELPLEFVREYDGAAEHFARNNKLPEAMGSPGALDYINADTEAFDQRVREFRYAHAMESTHAAFPENDFPSIEIQQAHWQAKDEEADEALRQQREREQLADVEREERERDHDFKWDHPRYDKSESDPERNA